MPKGNGKPIPKVAVNLGPTEAQLKQLQQTLQARFEENLKRHPNIEWSSVAKKLAAAPQKLKTLYAMETTAGEPDIMLIDDMPVFIDCSEQSPDRRSICYDRPAEELREKKGVYPGGNAIGLAKAMGIELLDENHYRQLQQVGEFDTSTSSWLKTPDDIRQLGGALFGDRRYDTVFTYHNGAESFYSARGFRGLLRL